jgi:DNA-binding transcriptional ArsR family regulator
MKSEAPGISAIIKAMNSTQRRTILRLLSSSKIALTFTEILNNVEEGATGSSRLSYHLSLLANVGLIKKNADGKYLMTQLGTRTALILEMTKEDEQSLTFSSLYLAFSNMTPRDALLAVLLLPSIIIAVSGYISPNVVLLLFGCLTSIGIVGFLYVRLQSLFALLLFSSFIWALFVPGKLYVISLYLLTILASMPLMGSSQQILPEPYNVLVSFIAVIAALFIATLYYKRYAMKL